jgi:hypothetical protein
VREWWNVMQWKTEHARSPGGSDPTYTLNVGNRPNGRMRLSLVRHIAANCSAREPLDLGDTSAVALPVGRWVHVEAYYSWAHGPAGRVTVWQDGRRVMNYSHVCTEHGEPVENGRQWSVNNYSTPGVSPAPVVIWIDDAAITTDQLGPNRATVLARRRAAPSRGES